MRRHLFAILYLQDVGDLAFAARVHDVGKIFVPERILNKPGPLTEGSSTY